MSETNTEVITEPVTESIEAPARKKQERTPAQLAALERAREAKKVKRAARLVEKPVQQPEPDEPESEKPEPDKPEPEKPEPEEPEPPAPKQAPAPDSDDDEAPPPPKKKTSRQPKYLSR